MITTSRELIIRGASVLVMFGLYWRMRQRMRASGLFAPEVRQAMKLQKTDPAAADRMMSEFFDKRADQEKQEREELRRLAPTDIKAAKELRKRLAKEIEYMGKARDRMTPEKLADPEIVRRLDTSEQAEEVTGLDATIQRLKGR